MAPITFDPKDAPDDQEGGFAHQPGRYRFKVDSASEVTFKTGSSGLKLKLLVDAPYGRYESKAFDNCVVSKAALWRLKSLCKSIGVPFESPLDPRVLEGKMGIADFKVEDSYLKVDRYLPPDAEGVAVGGKREAKGKAEDYDYGPPPMDEPPPPTEDDVPFA